MHSHPTINAIKISRPVIEIHIRPKTVPYVSQAMLNASGACSTSVCTDTFNRNNKCYQQAISAQSRHACYEHPATVHRCRGKSAWMKARVNSIPSRPLRKTSIKFDINMSACLADTITIPTSAVLSPKRKQVAFVKTQELKSILEAHVGTSHVSELWYDEDVSPHIHLAGIEVVTSSCALCSSASVHKIRI